MVVKIYQTVLLRPMGEGHTEKIKTTSMVRMCALMLFPIVIADRLLKKVNLAESVQHTKPRAKEFTCTSHSIPANALGYTFLGSSILPMKKQRLSEVK